MGEREHARERIVDLVRHPRRQPTDRRQSLRAGQLQPGLFLQELVPLLERLGHRIERLRQRADLIGGVYRQRLREIPLCDGSGGGRQSADGARDAARELPRDDSGGDKARQRDQLKQDKRSQRQCAVLPRQHADVQHADGLSVHVIDRLVGGNIPVVDHPGGAHPSLPLPKDVIVDLGADACADRPRPVFLTDVGGYPDVVLKNGGVSEQLALVLLVSKHGVLNLVHQGVVAIHQHP